MADDERMRLDRTAFAVTSWREAEASDRAHWRAQAPERRMEAIETLRQIVYGYDPATARLQRVFEVAELG